MFTMCLSIVCCVQYAGIIHLSEQTELSAFKDSILI